MVKKMQEQSILTENPTALFDFSVIADFEKKILSLASEMALILTDYEIDHMAVRVNHCKTKLFRPVCKEGENCKRQSD